MRSNKTQHHDCPICGMPTYLEDLLSFYQLFDDQAQPDDLDHDYVFCVNCQGSDEPSGVTQ